MDSQNTLLYSRNDHKRVRNLLNVMTRFMTFAGQTPYIMENLFPRILRGLGWFLACFYSALVIMQTLHISLLYVKTTYDKIQLGGLEEIGDAFTQFIISSFSCFSTCYWLWHMDALRKFVANINANYWHHSLPGLTFVSLFDVYVKTVRIQVWWVITVVSGVFFWGITPLLQRSHTLPLNCWYPFDALHPAIYPFIYVLQLLNQVNVGTTYSCGSGLYVSLIILMMGQLDILYCSLKNLQHHAKLLSGENLDNLRELQLHLPSPEDEEINQYMFLKEELTDLTVLRPDASEDNVFQQRLYHHTLRDGIVKCVKLHQFICESCNTLEKLFHPYNLIKSLQLTMQLCMIAVMGVEGKKTPMSLFNRVQYLALTLMELVLFTFYGELLQQHSVRSAEALFRSDWPSYANMVRKDILIYLTNTQKRIKLTAGKFFIMDIERLRLVIVQAFSFMTLLQNLAQKRRMMENQ